ncbi:MAG TPA: tRNA pseudouridine(55) synthase TruB [Methylophaga sp.]|nr:tRNA pseudouridine(55) synthase TruB [Methylophaga sp.]
MARRKKSGRDLTGMLIVDKPSGVSSNRVLQIVKRLFQANKAGHTGTLDPLASGVLPICLGEATKLSTYLLDADKRYQVTCRLGIATDSGDSDGEVIAEKPLPIFTADTLLELLPDFTGQQTQIPPMFSALKHQGQPLYKLARQGIEIKRKARQITIYDLQLLAVTNDSFTLEVACSKGTYIRTLVQDIAAAMGSCGHVVILRRTAAAGYDLTHAVPLAIIESMAEQEDKMLLDQQLLPAVDALPDWPLVALNEEQTKQLYFGQPVACSPLENSAEIRLLDHSGEFIGLAQIDADGVIKAKRLFVREQTQ